jgi:hypothetical protein
MDDYLQQLQDPTREFSEQPQAVDNTAEIAALKAQVAGFATQLQRLKTKVNQNVAPNSGS